MNSDAMTMNSRMTVPVNSTDFTDSDGPPTKQRRTEQIDVNISDLPQNENARVPDIGDRQKNWGNNGTQQIKNQSASSHHSLAAMTSFDMNDRGIDQNAFCEIGGQYKMLANNSAISSSADKKVVKLEERDLILARSNEIEQEIDKFSWDNYLHEQKATAVPRSAFQDITGRNPLPPPMKFVVGDMLEAVDPLHQSLICATSVVEVKGYRMRLQFEGYSTLHDFWVNADEKLIFPCGFCDRSGRKLSPPKEYHAAKFKWQTYAEESGKAMASQEKFRDDITKCYEKNSKFSIGEKLEAVDRQNPELICVATISDVIDDRVLIHFDGWNNNFDYWCDYTSNYIHPIGYCSKNRKSLAFPQDYGHEDNFSWIQYLKNTKSKSAPGDAFAPRTSHLFDIGMRLEAVDKRNPILVRVATVTEKNSYRIKIHFDGWDKLYDYWIDVDSTDLHPAGWCAHAGHTLQRNIIEGRDQVWQAFCPVPGCRGLGHIKGSKFAGHHSEYGCPYSSKNLDSYPIQDRIMPRRGPKPSSLMSRRMGYKSKEKYSVITERKRGSNLRKHSRNSMLNDKERNAFNTFHGASSFYDESSPDKRREAEKNEGDYCQDKKGLYYSMCHASLWSSVPKKHLVIYWEQCTRRLPGVLGVRASEICKWSSKEVSKFVQTLTGQEKYGEMFLNEEIDGEAFLLLTQNDILKVMKIKLGPTLKIHGAILYARANDQ